MREFVAVEVGGAGSAPASGPPAHLTLRFLGEISAETQERVAARLREVARGSAPFALRLEGVGAFPSAAHPRVVWVGVTTGREEIVALARRVRVALEPEVGPDREEFVPHLTLWRVRSRADREAAVELLRGDRPAPPPREVAVGELLLKQSVLGPGGAVHRTVGAFRLGGEPSDRP